MEIVSFIKDILYDLKDNINLKNSDIKSITNYVSELTNVYYNPF